MFKRIQPDDVDRVFPLVMKILLDNDREVIESPGFRTMFVDDLYEGSREQFNAQMIDLAAITSDWGFSPREVTVPVRSWHGGSDMLVPVPHAEHLVDLLRTRPSKSSKATVISPGTAVRPPCWIGCWSKRR